MEPVKYDKVSIIVPVYNAVEYIGETIESVIDQSYINWELLLVDDCSTDDSVDVILEQIKSAPVGIREKIRLIRQSENAGAAKARNRGITEAVGRYIAFLDADDKWMEYKLEKELQYMCKNEAAFVFTGYEFADERAVGTGKIVIVPKTLNYKEALQQTVIFTTTVIFDLNKITKEEIMMPTIKSEDTATWWRILKSGYTAYGLNENLALYRRPVKSLSSNKLEAIRRIWNLYRQVAKLSVLSSCYNFVYWALGAVGRRI